MHPLRRVSIPFVLCLVYYYVLVFAAPLMNGYRAYFRAGGNLLFRSFGSAASVQFEPFASQDYAKDTTLVLYKLKPRPVRGTTEITAVYYGYRPTVFLIALILATPIPWRRRLLALVWGLILINVFVAFRLTLQLFDIFSNGDALTLFTLSRPWKTVLKAMIRIFVMAPAGHYMGPAFIWLVVTFRRGDLAAVFGLREPSAGKGKAEHHESD